MCQHFVTLRRAIQINPNCGQCVTGNMVFTFVSFTQESIPLANSYIDENDAIYQSHCRRQFGRRYVICIRLLKFQIFAKCIQMTSTHFNLNVYETQIVNKLQAINECISDTGESMIRVNWFVQWLTFFCVLLCWKQRFFDKQPKHTLVFDYNWYILHIQSDESMKNAVVPYSYTHFIADWSKDSNQIKAKNETVSLKQIKTSWYFPFRNDVGRFSIHHICSMF